MLLYARYLPGRRVLLPVNSGRTQKLCYNYYTGLRSSAPSSTQRLSDGNLTKVIGGYYPSLVSVSVISSHMDRLSG